MKLGIMRQAVINARPRQFGTFAEALAFTKTYSRQWPKLIFEVFGNGLRGPRRPLSVCNGVVYGKGIEPVNANRFLES